MKLYMTAAQMNATDLAVLLPMLKFPANTSADKILKTVSNVPQNQLCGFLNAFSREDILDILSTATADYESKLLLVLEKLAERHGFPMEITGLSISKEGRIYLQIGQVDYPAIVSNYRPMILSGPISLVAENVLLQNMFTMLRLSLKAGLTVLARIPAKTLDTMVVSMINRNAGKLLESIKAGEVQYDFVEVMACKRGCIVGGGQPLPVGPRTKKARAKGIYSVDRESQIRFASDNLVIGHVFEEVINGKGHKLLHRNLQ